MKRILITLVMWSAQAWGASASSKLQEARNLARCAWQNVVTNIDLTSGTIDSLTLEVATQFQADAWETETNHLILRRGELTREAEQLAAHRRAQSPTPGLSLERLAFQEALLASLNRYDQQAKHRSDKALIEKLRQEVLLRSAQQRHKELRRYADA